MNPELGGPGSNQMDDEQDEQSLLQQLAQAIQAGDDAEADGMFSQDIPGVEKEGMDDGGMGGIKPEQLQQLLSMIQEKPEEDKMMPPGGM